MMDANGDGQLDLVYGSWNGYHRMYIQHADGAFIDDAPEDLRAPSKIRTVIAADWDNDGYVQQHLSIHFSPLCTENTQYYKCCSH